MRARWTLLAVWMGACAGSNDGAERPFDPMIDGFAFENYTNDDIDHNLTAVELQRMFGDRVCEHPDAGDCILTPPVREWMDEVNDAMDAGHCEGMAVLSQRFFAGLQRPSDFSAERTADLMLTGNDALQREIAYWFSLQILEPVHASRMSGSPTQVAEMLRTAMANRSEFYTVAFFMPDMSGGHAITPFDVVDVENEIHIVVYDNNLPGMSRSIEIDRESDSWSYFASINPDAPGSHYQGDAETQTLMIVPLSTRAASLVCPVCGDVSMDSPRSVSATGDARLLVRDERGRQFGQVNGQFLEEIPGATWIPRTSDLFGDVSPPIMRVPAGPLEVELSGDDTETPASISVSGGGYYVTLDDLTISPSERHVVELGAEQPSIRIVSNGSDRPTITLALAHPGADWRLTVRPTSFPVGQALEVRAAPNQNALVIEVSGGVSTTLDISAERVEPSGTVTFDHRGFDLASGSSAVLALETFDANGAAITVQIDENDDGASDLEMQLDDQS